MMESSNFYEFQQQELANFSSLAAPQSTTGWNPSLPLNNHEYDHYMNEILPMSAQLITTKNHMNYFGQVEYCDDEHESVITSSSTSTNLPIDFITNYFTNGHSSQQNLSFSSHDRIHHPDSNYISESSSSDKDKAISRIKRVSSSSQNDAAPKRQRAASHSSCTLPKVVKEKIGDRIAALHRLVAPFGKTDAASVLTEALGYIQFLHHQIQTLSMSCIKPSQSNLLRCFQRNGKECWDGKQGDLRSRGLSLVPISVAAYFSSSRSVGLD